MGTPRSSGLGGLIILLLGLTTLGISLDGKHYWHDIRFAYAASEFTLEEILDGEFNPHQLGGTINEVSAGGFYLAKLLHVSLLKFVFGIVSPAEGGFIFMVWASVLGMILFIGMCYLVFCDLFQSRKDALLGVGCILILPVTPYLAGKLLAEIPGLLFGTISIWALLKVAGGGEAKNPMLILLSGVFLLLAALTRLDLIVSYFGCAAAWLMCSKKKEETRGLIRVVCMTSVMVLLGYWGIISVLGKGFGDLVAYFREFTNSGMKSMAMSMLGFLTFGGMVYGLAVLSLLNHERKKKPSSWFSGLFYPQAR